MINRAGRMGDWIMPEPSLDEDDRFVPAMVVRGDRNDPLAYFAMLGPSGYGCIYCGGPYDGLILAPAQNDRGRPCLTAACSEHKAFLMGWMAAGFAPTTEDPQT